MSAPVLFSLSPFRVNNLRVYSDSFTFGRPNSFRGLATCIGKRREHIVEQGRCGRIRDDPKAAAACLLAWCTLAPDHPTKDQHVNARASTRQELLMLDTIEYGAQSKKCVDAHTRAFKNPQTRAAQHTRLKAWATSLGPQADDIGLAWTRACLM